MQAKFENHRVTCTDIGKATSSTSKHAHLLFSPLSACAIQFGWLPETCKLLIERLDNGGTLSGGGGEVRYNQPGRSEVHSTREK